MRSPRDGQDSGAIARGSATGMTRRAWLRACAAGSAWAACATSGVGGVARAFGERTLVDVCELDLGPGTTSRPGAWKWLLYQLSQLTSVEAAPSSVVVKADDVALFEHPFCVLLGTGAFADPSDAVVEQLTYYLAYGGFLFIDDTTASDRSGFDASVRRLLARVFPTRPLAPLPPDHAVHRTFFLIDRWLGRVDVFPNVEGVVVGNQAPVMYLRNDMSGALERDAGGQPVQACVPGGEVQRREAMKVGINLLMYSLTSDYKNDQAHVRALLLEGRGR